MKEFKQDIVVDVIKKGRIFVNRNGVILKSFGCGNKKLNTPHRCETINPNGYYKVTFSVGGKIYTCFSHQIVYIYFNGKFDPSLTIDHDNGIKTDNHPDNISLKTRSDQQRHNYEIGILQQRKGEESAVAILTKKAVIDIKKNCIPRHRNGYSVKDFSEKYEVDPSTISKVLSGSSWSHVTI